MPQGGAIEALFEMASPKAKFPFTYTGSLVGKAPRTPWPGVWRIEFDKETLVVDTIAERYGIYRAHAEGHEYLGPMEDGATWFSAPFAHFIACLNAGDGALEQRPRQSWLAQDGARRRISSARDEPSRRDPCGAWRPNARPDEAIIGAGAGTGISAKFLHKGGADLIFIYNSGRFRMQGLSSWAGHLPFGDANAIVMEMGEREVMPVVPEAAVIAGVCGFDPDAAHEPFPA